MGMVFGKIYVETPKYTVELKTDRFEIRRYPPQMAAEVTYDGDHFQRTGSRSGFFALAGYIGVLSAPENRRPAAVTPGEGGHAAAAGAGGEEREKIAMTAPVITQTTAAADVNTGPEKIAMTAPVITQVLPTPAAESESASEASGAPESTAAAAEATKTTMQFLLPASLTPDNTPVPTNPTVQIRQLPPRLLAALTFSGLTSPVIVQERAKELRDVVEKGGYGIAGEYVLARYNDPFTIPWLRTNEILYPVKDVKNES